MGIPVPHLDAWAQSLNGALGQRKQAVSIIHNFLQHSTELHALSDQDKIEWMGAHDVSPFVLLTDPRFSLAFVKKAAKQVRGYTHTWGEQSLMLMKTPEFFTPEAVGYLAHQIRNHSAFQSVRTQFFTDYKGQTHTHLDYGVVQTLMCHPHSSEALNVWGEHFSMSRSAVENALHHILNKNHHNVFETYWSGETLPVLESLRFYAGMGNPNPELLRNISSIWGVMGETPERMHECMTIIGQLSQTCGIDDIVARADTTKAYSYLSHSSQERLLNFLQNEPNETHQRMFDLCIALNDFGAHLYPILTAHNFSVGTSAKQRIMGDSPMTEYSYFVLSAFLQHASSEQWDTYFAELNTGDRLVVGTHDELKNDPAYMKLFLRHSLPESNSVSVRKM